MHKIHLPILILSLIKLRTFPPQPRAHVHNKIGMNHALDFPRHRYKHRLTCRPRVDNQSRSLRPLNHLLKHDPSFEVRQNLRDRLWHNAASRIGCFLLWLTEEDR